jgi:beta-galactosidase/beta-glucuronidase
MKRTEWQNLNGLWQYTVLPNAEAVNMPTSFQGNILVPFAVESALSGVGKTVGKDSTLWYKTSFNITSNRKGKKILLHFGAVDWRTDVYINGNKVGTHEGGFDPFTIDITSVLKKGSQQQLAVHVWDPTDQGPQPNGKQVKEPRGIWYTPVSGIWQTVWLEVVPESYIVSTKQTPDLDNRTISVTTNAENLLPGDLIHVSAWKGNQKIAEKSGTDANVSLTIDNPEAWSPSNPFLYDLEIAIERKGKTVDEVKSYFAMRKVSVAPDANGIQKMLLNNKFLSSLARSTRAGGLMGYIPHQQMLL